MKKSLWIIVAIVVVIILIGALGRSDTASTSESDNTFKVGAILALTGPAAIWGESVKNGIELALEEKTGIEFLYQDSKGAPADGLSAFNAFQEQGVDLTLSQLSGVSVPISKLAAEKKVPLLVTLVAASSTVIVNDYTVRYYTDPYHYSSPAFLSTSSPVYNAKKIAVIYRNDEFGVSVKDEIVKLAALTGKTIVYSEGFKTAENDFSTFITKAKASKAEVLVFVPVTPGEGLGIVKTGSRLNIGMPMIEAGALFADAGTRAQADGIPFHATAYEFSLNSPEADAFRSKYKAKFGGKEPNFGAAFGYDMVSLIDRCKASDDVLVCFRSLKENPGIAGKAMQVRPGDFVVKMHVEKVNQ